MQLQLSGTMMRLVEEMVVDPHVYVSGWQTPPSRWSSRAASPWWQLSSRRPSIQAPPRSQSAHSSRQPEKEPLTCEARPATRQDLDELLTEKLASLLAAATANAAPASTAPLTVSAAPASTAPSHGTGSSNASSGHHADSIPSAGVSHKHSERQGSCTHSGGDNAPGAHPSAHCNLGNRSNYCTDSILRGADNSCRHNKQWRNSTRP